jgi:hypothetical protein
MSTDQTILGDLINWMESGEQVSPTTDREKDCFQLIRDLNQGRCMAQQQVKNTCKTKYGLWLITWAHLHGTSHCPLISCVQSVFSRYKGRVLSYLTDIWRADKACLPQSGGRCLFFLTSWSRYFLSDVLGILTDSWEGFYGHTSSYYGTVEQQGCLTLHMHMLLS